MDVTEVMGEQSLVRVTTGVVLAAMMALGSCAVEVGPPMREVTYYEGGPAGDVYYVREAPPPPRVETVVGTAPGPEYVWVRGFWSHHAGTWTWVSGRWTPQPRPGVVWVPGRWEHQPRGHVWHPGHWK